MKCSWHFVEMVWNYLRMRTVERIWALQTEHDRVLFRTALEIGSWFDERSIAARRKKGCTDFARCSL